MPICIDKCTVMHCGYANERFNCTCDGNVIIVVEELNNLGVTRSQKLPIAGYKVSSIVGKANRMAGLMARAFCCRDCTVLWKAFSTYVLPTLIYTSPSWNLLCVEMSKLWSQIKNALLNALLVFIVLPMTSE